MYSEFYVERWYEADILLRMDRTPSEKELSEIKERVIRSFSDLSNRNEVIDSIIADVCKE